jgi:hypothetical protein
MANLLFIKKVKYNQSQFDAKVRDVASRLGIDPDWLMMCMNIESDLNSQAQNKYTGAAGLIQFMPSTAAGLGTTTAALLAMSNVEQMDYVYKYLRPYEWRMNSFVDVYFAIFFPRAMNKPDDYVLQTDTISAAKIAEQNPAYDDGSGQVTVDSVKQAILAKVPADAIDIENFQKKT